MRGQPAKPGGLSKYERLCGKRVFALTLTLSPRRGNSGCPLSLEGEGRGEGVALYNLGTLFCV